MIPELPRAQHETAVPPRERVRRASAADIGPLARTLALAFEDDPVSRWFFPGDAGRLRRLERMYRTLHLPRLALPHGETYTTESLAGAALWIPPGKWQLGPLDSLRLLPQMAAISGLGLPRALRGLAVMDALHPQEPHYYLPFLGVAPDRQNEGIGTALMRPVLRRCDREGRPAYLEATTPRNVALYERNGFRILDESRLPGGPPLWRMWRDPAGAS